VINRGSWAGDSVCGLFLWFIRVRRCEFGRLGSDYGRFRRGIGRFDGCFSRLGDSLVVSLFVMVV
jgi:hypothetical protein